MKRQKPKNDLRAVAESAEIRDLIVQDWKLERMIEQANAGRRQIHARLAELQKTATPEPVKPAGGEPEAKQAKREAA